MKTLRELFSKYNPPSKPGAFLDDCGIYSVAISSTNKNRYEITVHPTSMWSKKLIYQVEEEISKAYDSKYSVRFITCYPSSLYERDCLYELVADCEKRGLIPDGFFTGCEIMEGPKIAGNESGTVIVSIPFCQESLDFLARRNAEKAISDEIFIEFGIRRMVEIRELQNYSSYEQSAEMKNFYSDIDRKCEEALKNYEIYINTPEGEKGAPAEAAAAELNLTHINSAFDENAVAISEDNIITIGKGEFDISEPESVWGEAFRIEPLSISSIRTPGKDRVIIGTVGGSVCDTRNKKEWFVTFGVFDGNASMLVRFPNCSEEQAKENASIVADGDVIAVHGDVKKEMKSGELYMTPEAFMRVKRLDRKDKAKEKRVELHLHSSMSSMDALTQPGDVVKTAMKWGYNAIAITDHGNVQGFPDVMLAIDKKYKGSEVPKEERFKPIYGMEAYFVNDTSTPIEGNYNPDFNAPTVVFDLETTGLSPLDSQIIEFGAVKLVNGEVVDRFSSFVHPVFEDPNEGIPENITKLTSITNEMVADAPLIEEVLPKFMQFSDGCLLVAHNALFDTGFVREACKKQEIPFENPFLDTVALSRFINPNLHNHKLDSLADFYGLGDFNHHRAVEDAEMLERIYVQMLEQMKKMEIPDFRVMEEEIRTNSDPKKLKSYHMIMLVKNPTGLKNLYRLISESYLNYYYRNPRIPKSLLDKYREGLILGSACSAGELFSAILENRSEQEIEEIASYYDYLEVQPVGNDGYLIDEEKLGSEDDIRAITRRIVELGDKLNKPVCATSDSHFINPEDELYRRILQVGNKMKNADRNIPLYLRTTDEMLEEFSYLGPEKAFEIVVTNTNKIADMIGRDVRPIPEGNFPPHLDGAEEELTEKCWTKARSMYGEHLPQIVTDRLNTELTSIIKNGFAVLYVIAERLVHYSESQGYLVGSRGSVGSSFVAAMGGISEVNALPPHYYCKKCRFSDFTNVNDAGSGFDLPDAVCPVCGEKLELEGHDIPFETFLGFHGEKSPDIDLNFSGDVQGRVHKFTEELFGAENVFKAGTLSTLADKTAYGYVMKYYENKGLMLPRAEIERIVSRCMGVKKTTGQHPGGIIVVPRDRDVYEFTPVQHPADDPKSNIVTTHYAFSYLHDTILKLDELGHDIPTKYKYLEKYSGVPIESVAMNDRTVYKLFESTEPLGIPQMDREDRTTRPLGLSVGTLGIPEMGTSFIQQVLLDAKPKNFADLLQVSGLTHGTDVWLGNAQDLIKNGTCTISKVVGTRDGIMLDLIRYGVEKSMSFKIMEKVRKNKKGEKLPDEMFAAMNAANVPEWYQQSLQKIKYMFPKAHAAAYVMSAIRLAWYKVHQPVAFYCAMLTVAPEGFVGEIAVKGAQAVRDELLRIDKLGMDATANEKKTASTMQLAHECLVRGIRFLPVDLNKSEASHFIPENGHIRMPFTALAGLGEAVAEKIVEERCNAPFSSIEDLRERGKVNKGLIDMLRDNGVLKGMNESDQMSVFDLL